VGVGIRARKRYEAFSRPNVQWSHNNTAGTDVLESKIWGGRGVSFGCTVFLIYWIVDLFLSAGGAPVFVNCFLFRSIKPQASVLLTVTPVVVTACMAWQFFSELLQSIGDAIEKPFITSITAVCAFSYQSDQGSSLSSYPGNSGTASHETPS